MDKAGERLKKIRLDKGLSLEEVAKKTKVALNILKSIEDDGFINLEPVYVKGFIKIYCNFLGVQPADFIEEIKEPQVTMKLSDEEEKATPFLKPLTVQKTFPWRAVLIAAGSIAALFLIIAIFRGISRMPKKQPSRQAATMPAKARVSASKQQKKTVSSQKPVIQQAQSQNIPIRGSRDEQSGIRLGIHAVEDCWLQVKVDGKTIFQSVLPRGRMESWIARDRIDLWLGSAGGVELEVNGSRIPALGRRGQVLKNIVISKDGLKVGK